MQVIPELSKNGKTTGKNCEEFHTNDTFKIVWIFWRILGMHPFDNPKYSRIYYIYSRLSNIILTFTFPSTIIIYYFVESPKVRIIVQNIPILMSIVTAAFKYLTIWYMKERLLSVKVYLDELDARAKLHEDELNYLKKIKRYINIMYKVYSVSFCGCVTGFVVLGLILNKLPFDAWFPFDSVSKYYTYVFLYQGIAIYFAGLQNLANDTYPVAYLLITIAHLHVLQLRVQKIAEPVKDNLRQNYEDLVLCLQDHVKVMKIYDLIKPVISTTVFFQFIVTGLIYCLTATFILFFGASWSEILSSGIYLSAVLLEVFPVCFVSHHFLTETHLLRNSIFSCNWIGQGTKFQKTLIIFMQSTQVENVLLAGGLFPITLPTLLQIFKFSFSCFAIISQVSK